ncbi:helix-turn-helix domain-containing protein [Pseudomonas lopnurensis]|uniref:helix-turn-helix domain-containing protein n=1 Tax=Pseudomonas lopnurensis TaxID=1477517 RepID=UPI0018795AD5|nr:helix-turn-helix transcriptional regulator [Pseudomonas lopnurensis]MBE7375065.1 helix-turn-helix transcriptional regulator [Pseudomonas lopnurensis]
MSAFGRTLRSTRLAAGLTQEQLGFEVGVTKASISAWENEREVPSFAALLRLREVLKVSLDVLVDGWPNEEGLELSELAGAYVHDPRRIHDEREFDLLQRFRCMSGRRQDAFLEIMRPSD